MKIQIPRLYLGTMTFGWSAQTSSIVDENVAFEMLKLFISTNKELQVTTNYVDTARIYAGGQTEPIVGQVIQKYNQQQDINNTDLASIISLGTKAHPSVQPNGLSPAGIKHQFQLSCNAMSVSNVGEYYLHQPDTEHSLLESLTCAHELKQQGLISNIGMSNYHALEMKRAFELCHEYQLTPPSVYQGLYNPLNRLVESELIPILKENNCSFVAYNPLAAGLLVGKHNNNNKKGEVAVGRFKDNPNYLPRFYTDANFQAVDIIKAACQPHDISMVEATYRWLLCHSPLTKQDGILLGASSINQLEQNLQACKTAATSETGLPQSILDAFDQAWEITKNNGPFPYWRSYSSDMPNRESLDHGASYNAAKTK